MVSIYWRSDVENAPKIGPFLAYRNGDVFVVLQQDVYGDWETTESDNYGYDRYAIESFSHWCEITDPDPA